MKTSVHKHILFPLFFILILFSCVENGRNIQNESEIIFADLVEIEKIQSVKMSNSSGTFELNYDQIQQIKQELSTMIYEPNISAKVGAITIEVAIDGKVYSIYSSTQGAYIEIHRDMVTKNETHIGTSEWLYFKTKAVNFDNYRR